MAMERFYPFMVGPAGITPNSGYRGTDPINAIINAFCDPAIDDATGDLYFFGGGHGDGSCNAVLRLDARTLAWSVAMQPSPPSCYLPQYMNQTGTIFYPSGLPWQGFVPIDSPELNPALDAAYAAPFAAKVATHMYGSAIYRKGRIHYIYASYSCCDLNTGQWTHLRHLLGPQLAAIQSNLGSSEFPWGTFAVYDDLTDRAYVTLTGGGFRNHIAKFNCDTHSFEAVYPATTGLGNPTVLVKVGRKLWVLAAGANSTPGTAANAGSIFDIDTGVMQAFTLQGDLMSSAFNFVQEAVPAIYDSRAQRIRRWNYSGAVKDCFYSIDPASPVSGDGSVGAPFVFQQTLSAPFTVQGGAWFPGPASQQIMYVYKRLVFNHATNSALVLPRSDASGSTGSMWAIRMP